MENTNTPTQRYQAIQKRVQDLASEKIKVETEINLLRQDHAKTVEKLRELGVTELGNIDTLIAEKEQELEQMLTDAETVLTKAETEIAKLNL